jgi:hypothetical protein
VSTWSIDKNRPGLERAPRFIHQRLLKVSNQTRKANSEASWVITDNLSTVTMTVPIANYDNNQHAENENLRCKIFGTVSKRWPRL